MRLAAPRGKSYGRIGGDVKRGRLRLDPKMTTPPKITGCRPDGSGRTSRDIDFSATCNITRPTTCTF